MKYIFNLDSKTNELKFDIIVDGLNSFSPVSNGINISLNEQTKYSLYNIVCNIVDNMRLTVNERDEVYLLCDQLMEWIKDSLDDDTENQLSTVEENTDNDINE